MYDEWTYVKNIVKKIGLIFPGSSLRKNKMHRLFHAVSLGKHKTPVKV